MVRPGPAKPLSPVRIWVPPLLYLISTPIGNLGDLTYRAVEVLDRLDYLLCEDTRHAQVLLKHYNLQLKLVSYHRFNEAKREEQVVLDLKTGKNIGLVSDRGTPVISDPGTRLVSRCRQEGLKVTALPGPCAAINALSISGLFSSRFQFIGFLPKKPGELKRILIDALHYRGTTIAYEAAVRLHKSLTTLEKIAPTHQIGIARELTKRYEEFVFAKPSELKRKWKGEIVLLIPPYEAKWDAFSPAKHVEMLMKDYSLSRSDAVKIAASLRGVSKKNIYYAN